MTDPMRDIEDRKGMTDMGLMAIRIYQGALVEASNPLEAFMATYAYFAGMFKGSKDDDEEEGGETA